MRLIKWGSFITPKFTKALISFVVALLGDIVILLLQNYLAEKFVALIKFKTNEINV